MSINQVAKKQTLYYLKRSNRWTNGIGADLPEAYKKFWKEWWAQPTAVHYIEQKGKYVRDEETEQVTRVENIPLPLLFPAEVHQGLWGGEAVVQGSKKKGKFKRKVPHFWIPTLKKSVVYSEVLDTYMNIIMTDRALRLIHQNYGFDHYLLKTPAHDLKSLLALKLKRQILIALADETLYPNDSVKRAEVYDKYKHYLLVYTREEIEWYGHTFEEACLKWIKLKEPEKVPKPLKIQYRSELIAKLKEHKIKEAENVDVISPEKTSTWLSKLNPFSKNSKAE